MQAEHRSAHLCRGCVQGVPCAGTIVRCVVHISCARSRARLMVFGLNLLKRSVHMSVARGGALLDELPHGSTARGERRGEEKRREEKRAEPEQERERERVAGYVHCTSCVRLVVVVSRSGGTSNAGSSSRLITRKAIGAKLQASGWGGQVQRAGAKSRCKERVQRADAQTKGRVTRAGA